MLVLVIPQTCIYVSFVFNLRLYIVPTATGFFSNKLGFCRSQEI